MARGTRPTDTVDPKTTLPHSHTLLAVTVLGRLSNTDAHTTMEQWRTKTDTLALGFWNCHQQPTDKFNHGNKADEFNNGNNADGTTMGRTTEWRHAHFDEGGHWTQQSNQLFGPASTLRSATYSRTSSSQQFHQMTSSRPNQAAGHQMTSDHMS